MSRELEINRPLPPKKKIIFSSVNQKQIEINYGKSANRVVGSFGHVDSHTQIACIGKGIQPNPMYRVINRRVLRGGNHGIHPAIMGAMSFVSLSVGLITGLLVYFLIMRAITRSVE